MFFYILFLGACALGVWFYWRYSALSRSGLRHGPFVPLFGDMLKVMFQKEHLTELVTRIYESFLGDRFLGRYEFLTPYVVVKDPELLKRITVIDFGHFVDRTVLTDPDAEPMFTRTLLFLKGDEWKAMRSALSPMFTISKIRQMVPFMVEVGNQMIKVLETKIEQSKVNYVDLEAKDLMTRYTNDVIATCVFGFESNSLMEENEFYNISRDFTKMDFSHKIRFMGYKMVPWLMKMKSGESVNIPLTAIHRDPAYFENPLKFDPERFSEENKHKIQPYTYLPFGLGPRNCIGSRFALCEVKVMIYQLLLQMEVSPCGKTTIPAELTTNTFNLRLKGGHYLRMKPRK